MTEKLLGNLKKGILFIVSAPAGTGKTTLVHMLTQEFPCVVASISFTTRKPRTGEIDGVHYFFITTKEFEERIARGEFLEYVKLYGDYYGTSKAWVEQWQQEGKHVLLVIDTQGAALLKGKISAISIFLYPPSLEELERRLIKRQADSLENIKKRIEWAKEEEMRAQQTYDYRVVNDHLATAYQALRSILIAEEHRVR